MLVSVIGLGIEAGGDAARWQQLHYGGERLRAEVQLHAARCSGGAADPELDRALATLQRSYGLPVLVDPTALERRYQEAGADPSLLRQLVAEAPHYPDPLLLYGLNHVLPAAAGQADRQRRFQRLGLLLMARFARRPDLLLGLVAAEGASSVLKSLPEYRLRAGDVYSSTQPALMHLQELWVKGRYEQLLLSYCHLQLQARKFAGSDFVLRAYTIIGAIERTDLLFRAIYQRHTAELQPVTLSNMLFTALGLDQLDQAYVTQLVQHWRGLTRPAALLPPRPLRVHERPVLAVVSADLRMHPVGRFWLPLAQQLQTRYRLLHVGFNPHDNDRVREQLKACSDGWHLLESTDSAAIDALLRQWQPDLLLDLGGHTADNRPGLLNQRYAPVQATYLGFYGPTYGEQCDWWMLDAAIARRVRGSYPGSEAIWELDGPSLCYDPGSHGLPAVDAITYSEPDHPVIGSFNHTRKLTSACIARFGQVLAALPEAVLQFRSHSFYDPAVRRWFLRQFHDAGIAAHQLQPLPYAPSASDALNDYGRIHLHLDSYPVSGTTTTLDALAMGIPVLTCPNHLYAGAISAAILEQANLGEMVCEQPDQLPSKAAALCRQYATAAARRQLAQRVRASAICDTEATPRLFADAIGHMLKAATLPSL